jgi:L,D-transpeptidase ErfK/SrfK
MSVLLALLLAARPPAAAPRLAPPAAQLAGELAVHVVAPGESLVELALQYDVGFNAISAANPHLDPWIPPAGSVALIPTAWILPRHAAPGTVLVNLSEMRLFYLRAPGEPPVTFPIGVAMDAWTTPLGSHRVIEKSVEPTWYPTRAILQDDPTLPAVVPPGPDNPLGSHALRLSHRTILIHGTNRPFGVGRKVSHGCIRMYPDDIRRLFRMVDVGTPVSIVREPVKVAVQGSRIWVEVHHDEAAAADPLQEAVRLLSESRVLRDVDSRKLVAAARARRGIPVRVDAAGD